MKQLEITICGETESDLTIAIDEIKHKVEQTFLSGFDSNDTGNYTFDIMEVAK